MSTITGHVMSKDIAVVQVENGLVTDVNKELAPLFFIYHDDIELWLKSRAIDSHRRHSRLLKKSLRLPFRDDINTSLYVNAAKITDNYWFKPKNSDLTWEDVKFKYNYFDKLALRGDPDSFNQEPSKTPELTNTGSFEKCWRLIDGKWWLYKSGNHNEYFSELFICYLGKEIGFNMADYYYDDEYIKTSDFTDNGKVNFEDLSSVLDDNEAYDDNFEYLLSLSDDIARDYLRMIYLDTLCFNIDRHTANYGLIRDASNGQILSFAPNFDNNVALISRGYLEDISRQNDMMIDAFNRFIRSNKKASDMFRSLIIPQINKDIINRCIIKTSFNVDSEYICDFILNGQTQILKKII